MKIERAKNLKRSKPRPAKTERIPDLQQCKASSYSLLRGVGEVATLANSLRALPSFSYPTIVNATGPEREAIMSALDSLPLKDVGSLVTVRVQTTISNPLTGEPVGGLTIPLGLTNDVSLVRTDPEIMRGTFFHEVGHVQDFSRQTPFWFMGRSSEEPFGLGEHVSDYAETHRTEDFAESYEEFHMRPQNLRRVSPEKYAALESLQQPGPLESLVEREEFRETGKSMARLFGGNGVIRQVATVARGAGSLLTLGQGLQTWFGATENLQRYRGICTTLAGAALISGLPPLIGIGFQGAERALRGHHKEQSILGAAVGGGVGGVVGSLAGPYLGTLVGYHMAGGLGGIAGFVGGGIAGFVGGSGLGGHLGAKMGELV